MRWQRAAVVFGVLAVLGGSVVMGCVDGVTPDCSDAATQCGPDVDGAADRNEAAPLPDAAPPVDGATGDGSLGTDADADLDAGDEN